jgi:pilus assembly protein CpaF
MITLRVHHAEGTARRLVRSHRFGDGFYTVGASGCDVTLQFPTVSRRHGAIRVRGDKVFYADTGSRNGSRLAEAMLPVDAEHPWPSGTAVAIGPFLLSWRPQGASAETDEAEDLIVFAASYSRLLAEQPARALELISHQVESQYADDPAATRLLEALHHEFHGHGPLKDFLNDPLCREILVNAHDEIHVDTGTGLRRAESRFVSRETYEAWAMRTANRAGRRLDLQHPICEATLENGARFQAVLAPVSARGLSVAIRRFGSAPVTEEQALAAGWLDRDALAILSQAIARKRNIVVSGGTSTGKTSLLNFLCRYLEPHERIITVEDTVELAPPVRNLVQLQARGANADGAGEVTLRMLVQCALRMRPDRIIVGECRGAEVLEMLQALNTGHPGSLTTVHANSAAEALQRLELLALLGATNLSVECIREWIRASVGMLVQVERDGSGHRHVSEIVELDGRIPRAVYSR